MVHIRTLLNILLLALLLSSCGKSPEMNVPSPTLTTQDWQTLENLRVAFGHQSVGYNLMAGVASLAQESKYPLAIEDSRAPLAQPGIHHFKIGYNGDPAGKIADFDAVMTGGVAASVDIAMMKLCYIDFANEIDAARLADGYIAELQKLSAQYPRVTFIPITAPLETVQTGPKAWVKKLLGSAPGGYASNARRQLFNTTLRQHYGRNGILFDLAAFEASGHTGFQYDGQTVEALNPALTSDGGHLNERGQRLLGGALVHHLATVKHAR